MDELKMDLKTKYILHWNCRGFTHLPEALRTHGKNVKEIYLKWNNLTFLPTWLDSLRSLTNLYLPYNLLTSLPVEIACMAKLRVLDVSHNLLDELPSSLGELGGLSALSVNNNRLTILPEELCKLKSLDTLEASSNKIRCLPSRLDKCSSLREVFVDDNQLICLPNNIVQLPTLSVLCVSGNRLRYLPAVPFLSPPWLRFNDNPSLNYIPYNLGCQLTEQGDIKIVGDLWDLKSYNCLSAAPDSNWQRDDDRLSPNHVIKYGEQHFVLPVPLQRVVSWTQIEVPSLRELALRGAYGFADKYCSSWPDTFEALPSALRRQLCQGPASLCQLQLCRKPVFEFAVVWIVPMCSINYNRGGVTTVLSAVFFCSVQCSRAYVLMDPALSAKQVTWSVVNEMAFERL